jgi:MoxR-like ATPase
MTYKKIFNPPPPDKVPPVSPDQLGLKGDRRDGLGYVYSDDIILKVNVALVTGRPLLVRGPSGAGKSSLAANVARFMGWRYYEFVVTSRTQARDLLYTFDTLRRLSDAELGRLRNDTGPEATEQLADLARYIEPGDLWWALDQESAQRRGVPAGQPGGEPSRDPNRNPDARTEQAVVLIDEIDKADPDVPNDLLVPIGSLEFRIPEIGADIRPRERQPQPPPPLVVITTNNERELPNAFMRRCLILDLQRARPAMLKDIARQRFGTSAAKELLFGALADLMDDRPPGREFSQAPLPSTAEFIDALQACLDLNVTPDRENPIWPQIEAATLWKPREGGAL